MSEQSSSHVGPPTRLVLAIFLIAIAIEETAHAYIDPGTGAFILQGLVAGGLSVVFFFRQSIVRLTSYLRSKF